MDRYCLNRFDAIVYINLEGRVDRKEALLDELRLAGVDEGRLHRIEAVYDPYFGARGCAKSHLLAIEFAREQGFENVLILEDDCYFKQSPERVDRMIEQFFKVVDKWDVFLLGSNVLEHEPAPVEGVTRVKLATAAQAYCVNSHYYDELHTCLQLSVLAMGEGIFPDQAIPHDWSWNNLISRDKWYCKEIALHQRPGFSDIDHQYRDKVHPERFDG